MLLVYTTIQFTHFYGTLPSVLTHNLDINFKKKSKDILRHNIIIILLL